ncbi:hypothetical protein ACI65C_006995 [Semiaphis heraclei]
MATVKLNTLVNKFRERLVKIVTNVFVFLFLVYQLVCKRKQKNGIVQNAIQVDKRKVQAVANVSESLLFGNQLI